MSDYGGFKIARLKALMFLWEHYLAIYKAFQEVGEVEEAKKAKEKANRAFFAIEEIGFPQSEEKEANPKKYPSHRPSCPTDDPNPLHDIDPKQYW